MMTFKLTQLTRATRGSCHVWRRREFSVCVKVIFFASLTGSLVADFVRLLQLIWHRAPGSLQLLNSNTPLALAHHKAAALCIERIEARAGSSAVLRAFMLAKPPTPNGLMQLSVPPQSIRILIAVPDTVEGIADSVCTAGTGGRGGSCRCPAGRTGWLSARPAILPMDIGTK